MEKIREQFSSLQIVSRSTPVEDSVYLLDIDVSRKGSHSVAVSRSNKSIGVYDRETLNLLREYKSQTGLLHGVKFAHENADMLFSACSDGTVKCWDTRLASSEATHLFRGYPSNVFLSFDVNCNDVILCAGTEKVKEDVFMVFWDARGVTNSISSSKRPLGEYSESHSDDIMNICFHPSKPSLVVSGSTDGLVNVFDIHRDNEDDALTSTCNAGSSVSYVGWSGRDFRQVYCMTHNEGFSWWDLTRLDTEEPITLLQISDAREAVSLGKSKLNYLIGGFYHEKSGHFFILGGTSSGGLQLLDGGPDGLIPVGTLHEGHSAPIRSFYWNSADDSLLTGGEDAQLLLWKLGAVEKSLGKKTSMKMASSVHQRVRVHESPSESKKK